MTRPTYAFVYYRYYRYVAFGQIDERIRNLAERLGGDDIGSGGWITGGDPERDFQFRFRSYEEANMYKRLLEHNIPASTRHQIGLRVELKDEARLEEEAKKHIEKIGKKYWRRK